MNTKLIDSLVKIINSLTEEEKRTLKEKLYGSSSLSSTRPTNFADEPFVGMWQDREEMQDSSQWVRRLRQQEWTKIL